MRTTLKLAVTTLLATGLVACGDETTGLDDGLNRVGEISFSYAGAVQGTFSAKGALEFDQDGSAKLQSFAVATTVNDSSPAQREHVQLVAVNLRLSKMDIFVGTLPSLSTGTYSLNLASCADQQLPENCASLGFGIGVDLEDAMPKTGDFPIYYFTAGTLEVRSTFGNRIHGYFQGTAKHFGNLAAGGDFVPGAELTVTNGTFNLPLLDESLFDGVMNLLTEPRAEHSWWLPAASLLTR